MAFTNPIIGGGNALIRTEIKSPDSVTGVSGWSIKKDGSAEFNDVNVRGSLLLPGDDNSYVEIDTISGIPYISFMPENTGNSSDDYKLAAAINAFRNSIGVSDRLGLGINSPMYSGPFVNNNSNRAIIDLYGESFDGTTSGPEIVLRRSDPGAATLSVTVEGDMAVEGAVTIAGTFSRPGCVVSFGTPNITSGVVAQTLTLSVIQDSYGMWDAGSPTIVTIPKDGLYDVGMIIRYGSQNPNANLRQMKFLVNGAEYMQWNFPAVTNMNGTNITLNGIMPVELVQGDTITFQTLQNSGVTLNIVANSRGWVRMSEG
jgi:hypothetical protein